MRGVDGGAAAGAGRAKSGPFALRAVPVYKSDLLVSAILKVELLGRLFLVLRVEAVTDGRDAAPTLGLQVPPAQLEVRA